MSIAAMSVIESFISIINLFANHLHIKILWYIIILPLLYNRILVLHEPMHITVLSQRLRVSPGIQRLIHSIIIFIYFNQLPEVFMRILNHLIGKPLSAWTYLILVVANFLPLHTDYSLLGLEADYLLLLYFVFLCIDAL